MSDMIDPAPDRETADGERRRNDLLEAETPRLRRFARALAPDADAAADLVQDTVAQALHAWHQWRGDGPLRAWLFTIMRNLNRRDVARQARWRAIAPPRRAPEEPDEDPIEARTPAPEAVDPVYLGEVGRAVAELPDEQREVLFLVAVEGFSYQEAAEAVGAPIGTVMSRLSRARARLRAEVEPVSDDGARRDGPPEAARRGQSRFSERRRRP